jgi:hypothetical protein
MLFQTAGWPTEYDAFALYWRDAKWGISLRSRRLEELFYQPRVEQ